MALLKGVTQNFPVLEGLDLASIQKTTGVGSNEFVQFFTALVSGDKRQMMTLIASHPEAVAAIKNAIIGKLSGNDKLTAFQGILNKTGIGDALVTKALPLITAYPN